MPRDKTAIARPSAKPRWPAIPAQKSKAIPRSGRRRVSGFAVLIRSTHDYTLDPLNFHRPIGGEDGDELKPALRGYRALQLWPRRPGARANA